MITIICQYSQDRNMESDNMKSIFKINLVIVVLILNISCREHKAFKYLENNEVSKLEGLLKTNNSVLTKRDQGDYTLLGKAVINGQLEMVKLLVNRGSEIDSLQGRYLLTPVMEAASYGQYEIAQF